MKMKKILFAVIFLMGLGGLADAQTGIRVAVDDEGVPIYQMQEVKIRALGSSKRDQRRFAKQEQKFNKLRYNVIKVLPYANECARNVKIINAELQRIPTDAGKEAYLDSREHFLFGRYENEIKNLTISQGKVLVSLVDRQSGSTTYSLINDYKSKTAGFFWNGIGKIFGYDLKKDYDPEEEFAIEMIVRSIENGSNPTYYDYLEARNQ
jgi:Domain of unknown function (DUF4294)